MNEIIELLQVVVELVNDDVPAGVLLNTYSLNNDPVISEFSIVGETPVLIVIDATGIFLADAASKVKRTCIIQTTPETFEQMFMGTLSPLDAMFYNLIVVNGSIKDLISIVDIFSRFNKLYNEMLEV